MVGVVPTMEEDESSGPPGIWGVQLPGEVVAQARKAVTHYLSAEPGFRQQGMSAPFPWARVLYAIGHAEASAQLVHRVWGDVDRVEQGILALTKITGVTWRHARLLEHGVLELRQDVLGGSLQGIWSLRLGALTSQMPELYELAESRVISTLKELLLPLLSDPLCGANLRLTDAERGAETERWMRGLREALEAEHFPTALHLFCSG